MFVILDLQTTFHTEYVHVFMIYYYAKVKMSTFNTLLITAAKPKLN
jgi:hypothetical protein